MGRPALPPGAWGNVVVSGDGQPYKARARFRDRDGVTREVARFGQTKGAAKTALLAALAERQKDQGDGTIRSSMTIASVVPLWQADVKARDRTTGTVDTYKYILKHVERELGQLRLQECTVGLVDSAVQRVATNYGPSAAKTMRSVLNGIFGLAVRHGAVDVSPVRELTPLSTKPKKGSPRALTAEEITAITDGLRADERASLLDIPDVIDFLLATGCRIGEALAVRESVCTLTPATIHKKKQVPAHGTVEINATAVRITGQGMIVQQRPKTTAGWRVLALPSYAVEMLLRRATELRHKAPHGVVFGSPLANTMRDPSNFAKELRGALNRIEGDFAWVTAHTFRKTVATQLEAAGLTARQVADQLGHANPSMTQDVYFGRKVTNADAAKLLDR